MNCILFTWNDLFLSDCLNKQERCEWREGHFHLLEGGTNIFRIVLHCSSYLSHGVIILTFHRAGRYSLLLSSSTCQSSPSQCVAWSRSRLEAPPPCLLLTDDTRTDLAPVGTHCLQAAAKEKEGLGSRCSCSDNRGPFRGR